MPKMTAWSDCSGLFIKKTIMPESKKVINVSVAYEEESTGMKHSIKQKIETFKSLGEILEAVNKLEQEITGVVPMI